MGLKRDPSFGPVILAGLGGVWTELLHDAAVRLAPVDETEALEMLDGLKSAPLLSGYRGSPPPRPAGPGRADRPGFSCWP